MNPNFFAQGDPSDAVFYIQKGKVKLIAAKNPMFAFPSPTCLAASFFTTYAFTRPAKAPH
jgi:hypothetical protein